MASLSRELSERVFQLHTEADLLQWIDDVASEVGRLKWKNLGDLPNPVHAVEAASDPAAALVERVTNAIDAVLDREALRRSESAPSPHLAATQWFDVPRGGVSELAAEGRGPLQKLANNIRVANYDTSKQAQPTVVIQDHGCGQHPDAFPRTLLSIMADNKKSKSHQMGVYNAGGAATYAFADYTIIVSRRDPELLADDEQDEVGVCVVRYNELDPDAYKTGMYEYCVGPDRHILRLDLEDHELPNSMAFGTYVAHIEYELSSYSRAAYEPKQSLHHLFHAALPDPALPFWIEEWRKERFSGVRGESERRTVAGLLHRLKGPGTSEYHDERPISLGTESGTITLRYFVLSDGQDADAFTTSDQGVSFVLNGQRQSTKDRYWIKRNTDYHHISRSLIVLVDCSSLTNSGKRSVFASNRESSKVSPLMKRIEELVKQELRDDDNLELLNEKRRENSLANATKSTSEKVRRQLASRIAAELRGPYQGQKGGGLGQHKRGRAGRSKPAEPRTVDDSGMLETPDILKVLSDPVRITPGRTAPLRLHLNGKNGWIPDHEGVLNVIFSPELAGKVTVQSTGRLLGGEIRLTLRAAEDTPLGTSEFKVLVVEPALGLLLETHGGLEVVEAITDRMSPSQGGQPDVKIQWISKETWGRQEPPWDAETIGVCDLKRDDDDPKIITEADWVLNSDFDPWKTLVERKKPDEQKEARLRENYEFPICWALFAQEYADLQASGEDADAGPQRVEDPTSRKRREGARIGRAVLMAMEPELAAMLDEDE